jgi:formylglycine-generating enzyme required for sulfatase activity
MRDNWEDRGLSWKSPGFEQGPEHPVCGMSWSDARVFCAWLTEKERKAGLLGEGRSYRLPTDEEWSLAVGLEKEAGSTPREKDKTTKGVYPWGTQWPPPRGAGNYADLTLAAKQYPGQSGIEGYVDGFAETAPVGSFPPNPCGIHDLGGNLWEWCEDWYDETHGSRRMRGGGWGVVHPASLLSSSRFEATEDMRCERGGFRIVVDAPAS